MTEQPKTKRWEDMSHMERIKNIPGFLKAGANNLKDFTSPVVEGVRGFVADTYPDSVRPGPAAPAAIAPAVTTVQETPLTVAGAVDFRNSYLATAPATQVNVGIAAETSPQAAAQPVAPPAVAPQVSSLTGFRPQYEGQSLADYLAGRDDPASATVQANDYQGRLRRFDSEAAAAQNLTDGRAAYDAASEARSDGVAFRREQPGYNTGAPASVTPASDFNTARPDRAPGELSMADTTAMTGGDRKAARAMTVQQRNGLDPESRANAELDRRKDYATYSADLQNQQNETYRNQRDTNEAQAYGWQGGTPDQARQFNAERKEAAAFSGKYGERIARAEAALGRPLNDPSELFSHEFQQDRSRLTENESTYAAANQDIQRMKRSAIESQVSGMLEGQGDLSETVNKLVSLDPSKRMTPSQALSSIAARGGSDAEAASTILQSALTNATAVLSDPTLSPQFAETQQFAASLYKGIVLDAQRAGISTEVGLPEYTPVVTQQEFNQNAAAVVPTL